MKKLSIIFLFTSLVLGGQAQQILSLEQCRSLALENNKQLKVSLMTADVAANVHQAAKTKYLPRVDALAGYQHFTKEISLLNNEQKKSLSNLGTNSFSQINNQVGQNLTNLVQQGVISAATAQQIGQAIGGISGPITQALNNFGETVRDAFRTNTKNVYVGSVLVTQPIYMGGAIKTANDIAAIGEEIAQNDIELKRQNVLFAVDNAYWLIVSLKKKEVLANKFRDLMQKLDDDVHKMIREGVATRADGLKVDVAVNTADLQISRLQNGVSLAKMALCELCGIVPDGNVRLADEEVDEFATVYDASSMQPDSALSSRPEIRMIRNTIEISRLNTRLIRSLYMPHIALTGGYVVSNPNMFNGFEQKFAGVWNVGIVVQVPIWTWGENKYKIRAAKAATSIAEMELADVRGKIGLEIEQNRFRLNDANKQLSTANKNMVAAEENLRCANVGFKEGVMTVTEVMAAQTAWQAAKTAIIDAEIAVRTAQVGLRKAFGRVGE